MGNRCARCGPPGPRYRIGIGGVRGPGAGTNSLLHGDFHFGQLVQDQTGWLLIDADDAGAGPAAWDLGRPAAWFAWGLIDAGEFGAFVDAYLAAGGSGCTAEDPWRELDAPARAITVVTALLHLARSEPSRTRDELGAVALESCRRMAHRSML